MTASTRHHSLAIDPPADAAVGNGGGSQTLMRGLDMLEAVAADSLTATQLAARLGLTRSTAHRLASALVDRGYLAASPRDGYRLGRKLLELGYAAHEQTDLVQLARPFLADLSAQTGDTVHFGVLADDQALYLDKQPGRRRITISSRVGDRQPLASTGLGKALMLDHAEVYWRTRFSTDTSGMIDETQWLDRMRAYAVAGRAYDLEENEDQIRCVAAPVRDAGGRIVAALSVSSAAQYMADERMRDLSPIVIATAAAIGRELGAR